MPAANAPNPVGTVVGQLGGAGVVAQECAVSRRAVLNWCARGDIPARHIVTVWRMAKRAGLAWRPPGSDGLDLVEVDAGASVGPDPEPRVIFSQRATDVAA